MVKVGDYTSNLDFYIGYEDLTQSPIVSPIFYFSPKYRYKKLLEVFARIDNKGDLITILIFLQIKGSQDFTPVILIFLRL